MSQEGSYRAPSSSPTELHCGQPTVALNSYRGCTACNELFTIEKGKLQALDRPNGITLRWRESREVLFIERAWRTQLLIPVLFFMFAGAFSMLWGSVVLLAGLGLLPGDLMVPYAFAVAMGLGVLAVGAATTYVSAAFLLNRTTISLSPTHVGVHAGPLPWGRPLRVERTPTDRVIIERATALRPPVQSRRRTVDRVIVERVLGNDAPALPRPPIPERYQLHFTAEDRAPLILLAQLPSHATADQLRHLLDALLSASEDHRVRVELPSADSDHIDEADSDSKPSNRQKQRTH